MALVTIEYDLYGHLDGAEFGAEGSYPSCGWTASPPEGASAPVPVLTLRHRGQIRNYRGRTIDLTDWPLGRMITVALDVVPDLGTTLLSLLLPEPPGRVSDVYDDLTAAAVKAVIASSPTGAPVAPVGVKAFNLTGRVRIVAPGDTPRVETST
jgi:hypothetical protein